MNRALILPALLFAVYTGGCAEPGPGPRPVAVDLAAWQRALEHYVRDEGNGDPNILRDTTLPTSQRGYALIGEPSVARSSDADGLLLGLRVIDGKPWYIFLVGFVREGSLDDVRLACLSWTPQKITWRVSLPEEPSLLHYNASEPPQRFTVFPAAGDQFSLAIQGDEAIATHTRSGATWRLRVTPAPVSGNKPPRNIGQPAQSEADPQVPPGS